ncbi:MAG: hypothetical protein JWM85_1464 [Acidimicrobiaceae bacterium]|nr:hypothetical protein [Acidimicrobiaceae bacterium]
MAGAMKKGGLSVCCPAGDSFERVAVILSMFRDVADEIVCCTNSAPAEIVYEALGGVADRIIHYQWRPDFSLDQVLPWVYEQCSHDWLFVVHNDEVPSQALLAALPDLRSSELFGHVTTRRWVYGDDSHWLNEYPWEPDFQLRMLRNDRASLQFQRRTIHGGSLPTVPYRRHLDLPLYHLDNLVNGGEARRRKVQDLDAFAPRIPLADGRSISDIYYQPERYSTRLPAAVPTEDVPSIRRVLASGGPKEDRHPVAATGVGHRARLTTATADEVFSRWPGRPLADSDYLGTVRLTESPLSSLRDLSKFFSGEQRILVVEIVNTGTGTWDCDGRGAELYLASRWLCEDDRGLPPIEGPRVVLPSYVHPGERDLLLLPIQAPGEPGEYLLEVDLLHEHVRWFGCGTRLSVSVSAGAFLDGGPAASGAAEL